MPRNRWRKKKGRMRPKKILKRHELPYMEILKSGPIRPVSGAINSDPVPYRTHVLSPLKLGSFMNMPVWDSDLQYILWILFKCKCLNIYLNSV